MDKFDYSLSTFGLCFIIAAELWTIFARINMGNDMVINVIGFVPGGIFMILGIFFILQAFPGQRDRLDRLVGFIDG